MLSANMPPSAMPMGEARPIAAMDSPSARPVFSSATLRWMSVISGPLNQAHATAMTAHSATNTQNMFGVSRPQAMVVAPTIRAATPMSSASLLPPPQAMSTIDPHTMPMPNAASTSEAA